MRLAKLLRTVLTSISMIFFLWLFVHSLKFVFNGQPYPSEERAFAAVLLAVLTGIASALLKIWEGEYPCAK